MFTIYSTQQKYTKCGNLKRNKNRTIGNTLKSPTQMGYIKNPCEYWKKHEFENNYGDCLFFTSLLLKSMPTTEDKRCGKYLS